MFEGDCRATKPGDSGEVVSGGGEEEPGMSISPALPHFCSSLAIVRERSVSLVKKKKNIAPQVELFML